MSDLISRQEAIDAITKAFGMEDHNAVAIIKALPSADRPTGKWINHFDDVFPEESTIECSVCHKHQPIGIDENYCPNCGAKMEVKNEP